MDLVWPPPNGELLLEAVVPGDPVPAGSKRGTAVRFKNEKGRWRIKTWFDKQGHEHAQINVSDVNESKLKKRAKIVEEHVVAAVAASGFLIPEPKISLAVQVLFFQPRAKSHYRTGRYDRILKPDAPAYPAKAPDTTKLWRGFEDSLTGLLWHDDAYISRQLVAEDFIPWWKEAKSVLKLWKLPAAVSDLPPEDVEAPGTEDEEQASLLD